MNQGNFLDSLLNTKAVKPVNGQNQAAKPRQDVSDKFRDTFTQLRPQVAAANTVARPQSAERSETRPTHAATKPAAREQLTQKSDSGSQHTTRSEKLADKEPASLNQAAARDAADSSPPNEPPKENVAAPLNEVATNHTEHPEISENAEVTSPEPLDLSLLFPPGDEVVTDTTGLIPKDVVTTVANDGDNAFDDAALLTATADTFTIDAPQATKIDGTEAPMAIAPLGMTAVGQSDLKAGTANGVVLNGQPQPAGIETEKLEMTLEGDAPAVEENPDFLLLGARAAAKSVETKATAEPLDIPKPNSTPVIAESLARLTEAQSPAARSFVVQTGVPVTLGQPQWSQAVGEKVLWLAAQNVSAAEIRLDPPDMGQLHVKVSVNQEQATVSFISPHPAVRDALDQQLNRLREMFSEQGLNLVNVDVSDRSNRQEQSGDEHQHARRNSELDEEELAPVATSVITATRLVDHYA